MTAASETIDDRDVCGICYGSLLTTRYVYVEAAAYSVLCSKTCLRAAAREERRQRWKARRRAARRLTIGLVLGGGLLTPHQGPARWQNLKRAPAPVVARKAGPPSLAPGWFGPEWPPSEMSLLAALGRDTWVHPLAGPVRRMPRSDSRVFGAVRPGDRPIECRNGHCGVDLGGEIWGEHVHAVHDGVIDYVQRGPNPDRGGSFVRIAHRDGTVFSQYFHLAAIPRGLERGVPVRGGEVIGLLGDTGVKESAPHLHFAMSARPANGWPERYMDPEPLIALWPLRVPINGTETGLVTIVARPGVPLGSARPVAGRKRKPAKSGRARAEDTFEDGGEAGQADAGNQGRQRVQPSQPDQPNQPYDESQSGEAGETDEPGPPSRRKPAAAEDATRPMSPATEE